MLRPAEETLAQGSNIGRPGVHWNTLEGVIRCSTVRELSAEERWDKEFVLSIKGTPWSPDGERAGDVNIRVDLPESWRRQGAHPPDVDAPIIPTRMRPNREMFEEVWSHRPMFGLRCHSGIFSMKTTLSAVAKGLSMNSRKSLKALPRSLATETESSEPETCESRTLINCQTARSLKELARQALVMVLDMNRHHAQLNRVPKLTSLRENRAILRVTGGDTESRLGRKEKRKESGSTSLMAKTAMWPKKSGCECTVVPNEICSLPTTGRQRDTSRSASKSGQEAQDSESFGRC